MFYSDLQIVMQEVPGEISICYTISGCTKHCKGCHSPHLWKEGRGTCLNFTKFAETLNKYKGLASCVLFMGGEWHANELVAYLKYARKQGFKTCLYTGEDDVAEDIKMQLSWLKTGSWMPELGGLDVPQTNQKFIETKSNTIFNHLFIKN